MTCYHELVEIYKHGDQKLVEVNLEDYKEGNYDNHENFYEIPQISDTLKETRPWKKDPNYFKKAYVSALALMKMVIHAKSGGSIEVMGMLTGKIISNTIIVMDVYQLPVEGTETRVNAQAEGYEYMVQYLESLKASGNPEHIVGWYHSHPGYGCWLSGIDVGTQALNQNFQDPYLALVIDPLKTMSQNKVEIGAFRTYPEDSIKTNSNKLVTNTKIETKSLPRNKRQDFGIHSDKYYSLDIEIFTNELELKILSYLLQDDNCIHQMLQSDNDISEINDDDFIKNSSLNSIFNLINLLKNYNFNHLNLNVMYNRKFEINFENIITKKLNQSPKLNNLSINTSFDKPNIVETSDEEMVESDAGQDNLDVSDADDAISIESSTKQDDDDYYDSEMKKESIMKKLFYKRKISTKKSLRNQIIYNDENIKLKTPKPTKLLSLEILNDNRNIGKQQLNELITLEAQMKLFM